MSNRTFRVIVCYGKVIIKMSVAYSNVSSHSNHKNDVTSISSFTAKLRRLKIEESILLQNVNKGTAIGFQSENEANATCFLSFFEFKKFLTNTKNSYNELKQLFEDIKASTSTKEVIKSIDIDEIKKSTHELENNIKSFKTYLLAEITALKSAEQQLNQKLNDPVAISNLKRRPRVQTAKYTEIVPSPVKTIMTSPFKCTEVQEFQKFMQSSRNRYGGWNEYLHNIFVSTWQKHFDTEISTFTKMDNFVDSEDFKLFLNELIPKLLGVSQEDVISHVKWYIKYVNLKVRQQKAIDKWRSNRRMMKPSDAEHKKVGHIKMRCAKNKISTSPESTNKIVSDYLSLNENQVLDKESERIRVRKCLSADKLKNTSMVDIYGDNTDNDEQTDLHFLKSTRQWHIRCSTDEKSTETKITDVEGIKKLGIPNWRAGL